MNQQSSASTIFASTMDKASFSKQLKLSCTPGLSLLSQKSLIVAASMQQVSIWPGLRKWGNISTTYQAPYGDFTYWRAAPFMLK